MPWGISAKKWIHKNGIQSPFRKLPSEIQPIVNMDRDSSWIQKWLSLVRVNQQSQLSVVIAVKAMYL